ncbi:MAG: SDR family NAD(P)-dependent oxidoreductase [Pseudomonadota bacterium]
MRLKGKTALIAGASRNIGRSIALAFAKEGAELILIAREHGDELKQVARECEALGAKALSVQRDLAKYVTGDRMICAGGRYM